MLRTNFAGDGRLCALKQSMGQGLPLSGKAAATKVLREHTGKAKSPCGDPRAMVESSDSRPFTPESTAKNHRPPGLFDRLFPSRSRGLTDHNVPAARYFSNWQALDRVCRRRDTDSVHIGFEREWSLRVGRERQKPSDECSLWSVSSLLGTTEHH